MKATRGLNIKTSLDAVAIDVMRKKKKRNKVREDNVETPTQTQTGDEERAWRNGIRSGLQENLGARLRTRRCRTGETLNGNPEPSSEERPAGKV